MATNCVNINCRGWRGIDERFYLIPKGSGFSVVERLCECGRAKRNVTFAFSENTADYYKDLLEAGYKELHTTKIVGESNEAHHAR